MVRLGMPYVVNIYEAQEAGNRVRLTIKWGAKGDFVPGLSVSGVIDRRRCRMIDFLAFPKEVVPERDAQAMLGYPVRRGDLIGVVRLYNGGKRIDVVVQKETVHGREDLSVSRYVLIGTFLGEETGRRFLLYASNSNGYRDTGASERTGAKRPAPQMVS